MLVILENKGIQQCMGGRINETLQTDNYKCGSG